MSYYVLAGVDTAKMMVLTIDISMIDTPLQEPVQETLPQVSLLQPEDVCATQELQWKSCNGCGIKTGVTSLPRALKTGMIALMDWLVVVLDLQLTCKAVCINDNLIILRSSPGQQHKLQRCDLKDCGTNATSIINYEDLLPNTDNEVVTGIAATDTILFIVTDCCGLWSCYDIEFNTKPEKISLGNRKVRKVSCGKEHTVVLTYLGEVYTFGGGSRGQLGHGDLESLKEPKLVDSLSGVTITSVECGGWHTLALSDIGDVYSWGWNESGQVGVPCMKNQAGKYKSGTHEGRSMIMYPTLLFADNDELMIEQISCGTRHSAAISAEGNLYMWGWNGHGQLLMRDEISIQDTPAKTHCMMQKCAGIKCGGWSTLVTYDPPDPALSPAMVPYHNKLRDQGVTSITP